MSRIKKFNEFMPIGFKKILNQLVIIGKLKSGILRKEKDFEMQIYYTPVKKKIAQIDCDVDIKELKLTFDIGDDISLARDLVFKRGWEIKLEIDRLS